jgi:hypothetical protein
MRVSNQKPRNWRRRSVPTMVGGIVMIPLGTLAALVSVVVHQEAPHSCTDDNMIADRAAYDRCVTDTQAVATLVAVSGAAAVAAGIPLIVWGAARVPKIPARALALSPWVSPKLIGLRVQLQVF